MYEDLEFGLIAIADIVVEEEDKKRIRTFTGKDPTKLEESVDKIGLLHPIVVNYNPQLYGKKYKLCSGYLRLQNAVKRGQEKIWANVKKGLTRLQELEIELAENEARFDFNDAERDIFMAMRKRLYEQEHPTTRKGANIRKGIKGTQVKDSSKTQRMVNFAQSLNGNDQTSQRFTEVEANRKQASESTIKRQVRVGEAIIDGKYSKDQVADYRKGKKTQSDMLEILKNHKQAKPVPRNGSETRKKSDERSTLQSPCPGFFEVKCPECGTVLVLCKNRVDKNDVQCVLKACPDNCEHRIVS